MKTQIAGLAIATFLFTSCEKNKTEPKVDDSSIKNPSKEIQAPAIAEHVPTVRSTIPSHNSPVTPEMIRSAGVDSGDSSWETLSAEQKIEKFRTKGIIRMPKDISDELIANAVSAGAPEVQVQFIVQQASAWHQIKEFKEGENDIPEHLRTSLIENLAIKYDNSWMAMVPEIEEQIAASRKVMEFRMKGIPGLSADESHDLMIQAIERYGADYKSILSIAEKSAKK